MMVLFYCWDMGGSAGDAPRGWVFTAQSVSACLLPTTSKAHLKKSYPVHPDWDIPRTLCGQLGDTKFLSYFWFFVSSSISKDNFK